MPPIHLSMDDARAIDQGRAIKRETRALPHAPAPRKRVPRPISRIDNVIEQAARFLAAVAADWRGDASSAPPVVR